ncbi:pyridoxamine 5'-phosphate oxidase-domain-containing protein [Chaetomium fimeti]|uniref:Pyridoxamine 5'-phosphate oxidase-domain-containing protein n=1 Tax=Chaetomium fimeti TaxID=1854472 RepID=A0AAE0LUK0_9PEZI|nr:pyridoxamine 5'-phosphate oxidase-domain-containing protein [Chaetomium fimeti]
MRPIAISSTLLFCTTATAAAVVPPPAEELRIPTSYESAVLGRRILALTPLGTLSTVFPQDKHSSNSDGPSTQERRPAGLGGMPYGLMEYIADCEADDAGNPTILAITIGTTFKNAAAGSNVSLAVQWTPPHPPAKRIKSGRWSWLSSYLGLSGATAAADDDDDDDNQDDQQHHHDAALPYSAANLPRFSLLGHLERIEGGDDREGEVGAALASCYVKSHPDARYWLPGNRIHEAHFVRLVVEQVYWVGGFGDRAFIGWIPVEEWQNVTREEWQNARLPGEKKGWKEWSVQADL